MDNIFSLLNKLKSYGCCGIKLSFEDEGALLNEMITMRYITSKLNIDLTIKIGGSEAKRDINDCIDLNCDKIVAPMIESDFALYKYIETIKNSNYNGKIGFNLETIQAYNNLNNMVKYFDDINFITVGRSDLSCSLGKDKNYVDNEEIYNIVKNVFIECKKYNKNCYMGGNLTINSKDFIIKLKNENLIDKFESRYIIFNIKEFNIDMFDEIIKLATKFEIEWLKYIRNRYLYNADKNINRIKIMEERI